MKKIIISAFACCIIFSVMFAVSCNKQTQLDVPQNLHVDTDDYLRWNEVKNAEYYLVNIDGKEYRVKTNEIDLFDKCTQIKKYPIRITAVGKSGVAPSDSAHYKYDLSNIGAFGFKNTKDGNGYIITVVAPEKLSQKVIIPSEISGTPVVEIYRKAFWKCETITSVYIPDSIVKIGSDAFAYCKNLQRVKLPAFIESISNSLFIGCRKLKEIEIPNGVKNILNLGFLNCESLKEIEIPESVTSIALGAFGGCNLKQLRIPKFVDSMEPYGINADEVIVDPENKKYYSVNNCILTRKDNVLFSGGKNGIIPEIVSVIGEKAFYDIDKERIDIPGNIKTIANKAFSAARIQEAYIENGVEEIISEAFLGSHIKKITIPESVTKIEDGSVITSCVYLEEVVVSPENKNYSSLGAYILTKDGKTIIAGNIFKPIPQSVSEIGTKAFIWNRDIVEVIIPENITKIDDTAFFGCTKLKKVVIEGSGTIGDSAFSSCDSLTSIFFSKNIDKISDYSILYSCNIAAITLPDNVTLGADSFYTSIWKTIYYPEGLDLSATEDAKRRSYIQSKIEYDGKFPYVKQVQPIDITKHYSVGDKVFEKKRCEYDGGSLYVPERQGYTFKGWSKNEDCSTIDYPVLISSGYKMEDYPLIEIFEKRYTNSPFGNKDFNEFYDPTIKTLYAVWEKAQ